MVWCVRLWRHVEFRVEVLGCSVCVYVGTEHRVGGSGFRVFILPSIHNLEYFLKHT